MTLPSYPSAWASHEELVAALIGRWPESHPQPSLARIRALCELLGDPQQACPVIQVTGTNGKGSTAIMIDALLRSMGLRTGRFSSPHLEDARERISVDGEPISEQRFDQIWHEIAPMVRIVDEQLIEGVPLTFFEVITAMAYAAFADAPVDVAVVEVGMGGTWDATSVADAQVAVVTPISLDHTHLLGQSITEIATEKAGIIKPGATAVLAGQQPDAAGALVARCLDVGAQIRREGIEFGVLERQTAVGGQLVRIDATDGPVADVFLPLFGAHMAQNAALAVAAVEAFRGAGLSAEVITEGMAAVQAPARLELVNDDPVMVLDTAHNPHGVRAALAGLREALTAEPLIGVVAMMRDKAAGEVLDLLAGELDTIVVTSLPGIPRSMRTDELAEQAAEAFSPNQLRTAADPARAIELARMLAEQSGSQAVVLVIGSVYLAGQARTLLQQGEWLLGGNQSAE
ncbi:MAG: bifunctional folylpolyglutamate synthase/dihydrofolate synthase [Brooklawnia sp.]